MTLVIVAEAGGERMLPEPVSASVLAGANVLSCIRRWRGLTQGEFAQAAAITQSFLSALVSRHIHLVPQMNGQPTSQLFVCVPSFHSLIQLRRNRMNGPEH